MGGIKPNFKKAYNTANEVLLMSHTITTLPVDIYEHIRKETDIKLYSYERAKRKYGVNVSDLGSDDALLTKIRGRHILFYKNLIDNHRRTWSVCHESGHYYLEHNLDSQNISQEEYQVLEVEANYFAAQVLMPDQVILELIRRGEAVTVEFLVKKFDVSREAASKRMDTLYRQAEYRENCIDCSDDESILLKFSGFIEEISPTTKRQTLYEDEEEMQKERDRWLY